MNGSALSEKKGFLFSLRFVSLFAAAHILLVFLQSNFLPLSDGWNTVWLGLELLLGAGAFLLSLGMLLYAQIRKSVSLEGFRSLFGDIRSPGFYLLLIWVVWAYIACLLAIREGRATFYHNVRYLFYQTADLLVLFPLGVYYGRRGSSRFLCAVYDACLALFTFQLLYSLIRFVGGSSRFEAFFGRSFDFSILRPVFGVNQNHTGGYAAFFLSAGIWRFRHTQSRAGKAVLIAALFVCFIAFAMVESRGAILALAAGAGIWAAAACWRRRKSRGAGRMLLSLLCCFLGVAAFLLVFYGARTVILSAQDSVLAKTHAVSSPAASSGGATSHIAPAPGASGDQEMRSITGKGASNLGGRKKIWLAVIRNVGKDRHILLHGSSMANTSDWVESITGKAFRTHNQLLELLVAQGMPALLLFLLWLFWLARKSLALAFSPKEKDWVLPIPLLVLIVHNMVEMMIMARPHVVCGFFYLIAGYTAGLAPVDEG